MKINIWLTLKSLNIEINIFSLYYKNWREVHSTFFFLHMEKKQFFVHVKNYNVQVIPLDEEVHFFKKQFFLNIVLDEEVHLV